MSAPPGSVAAHLRRLSSAALAASETVVGEAERYLEWARETLESGGRLLWCGNGGSAATVEHVAAEYAVRFRRARDPFPALALSTSSAALTAAANDFGFESVFARAVRAHGRAGDLLVLHSTSGRSPNLLEAARAASGIGIRTVALLDAGGGELAGLVDLAIRVPCEEEARVQEIHLAIEHAVVERLENLFADRGADG